MVLGETIQLAHGGGGSLSHQLIEELLVPAFGPADGVLHDAAVLTSPGRRLAFTTDSYVVRPLFFPGGDIGRLSVLGSVNDLAMAAARPVAMSLGLILEEGLAMATLERVVDSIRLAAQECGVPLLTGDTKVVEHGKADGLFINTSAIGVLEHPCSSHPSLVRPGDAVLVSGDLGRHGLAILVSRGELGLRSGLESDLASLQPSVQALLLAGVELHCLRDLTRGGLASAIDEVARAAGCEVELDEGAIPIHPSVAAACDLLGLDSLAMANEGRMLLICPPSAVDQVLNVLRQYRPEAACVGEVMQPLDHASSLRQRHPVSLRNSLGVLRPLEVGRGEHLPRIC